MEIKKILVCIDGGEHTKKAEDYAMIIAKQCNAELVALYVVNPFLKKFTDEIYAVNRNECRAHLDRELEGEGNIVLSSFVMKAKEHEVHVEPIMQYGYPEEVILNEAKTGGYSMVIMGTKLLRNWKERFESFKLPEKIFKSISCPVLFVR